MRMCILCASFAGCARPQYVSQEHAAFETPVPIADGDTGKPPLHEANQTMTPSAGAPERTENRPSASALPGAALTDPRPKPARSQFELLLRYCNQRVHLIHIRSVELKNEVTLPNRMGRFAVEFGIGRELLERMRFDFPLLGADPVDQEGLYSPPKFAPKADVSRIVRVAARPRARWARIVDRTTGETWPIEWPVTDLTSEPLPLRAANAKECPSDTD